MSTEGFLRNACESVGWGVACINAACLLASLDHPVPATTDAGNPLYYVRGILMALTWLAMALAMPVVIWVSCRRPQIINRLSAWFPRMALGIAAPGAVLIGEYAWWQEFGPSVFMLWWGPWVATVIAWACFGRSVLPLFAPVRFLAERGVRRALQRSVLYGLAGIGLSGGLLGLLQFASRPERPSAPDPLDIVGWLIMHQTLLLASLGSNLLDLVPTRRE